MYPFQRIYNPRSAEVRAQYIRSSIGSQPSPPRESGENAATYFFTKNENVCFGEYFNSLFEDELCTIAEIGEAFLELEYSGHFILRIVRTIPDVGKQVISDLELNSEGDTAHVRESLELMEGRGSRISFEMFCVSDSGSLISAEWKTSVAPRNEVKLAIVTTTFKNEDLIDENISNLLSSEEIKKENIEVIVIDNASTYDPDFEDERFHLIQQGNVGGSGGFTRGIFEVVHGRLSDEGFTHILLMDDDIKLHLSSILRIFTFYKYSQSKVTLGGAMLDLNRPNYMFEAGAFSCRRTVIGSHNDVTYEEASTPTNLNSIGKCTNYDYCGWWFYSFPVSAVEEIGLPKPLFIRGDDVDYGERLNQADYKVYCLGGVGVWHLHFLEKPISWVVYYVFRNHLILLSTSHKNRGWNKKSILRFLHNTIFYNLCQYDYGHAALVLQAVEDFLEGPDYLKSEKASDVLSAVFSNYKAYNSSATPEEVEIIQNTRRLPDKKRFNFIKKISRNHQTGLFKKQTAKGFEIIYGEYVPKWNHTPEGNGYVLVDPLRNNSRVFERDEIKLKSLSLKSSKLLKRFDCEFLEIQEQFRAQENVMHSVDYWNDYFSKNNCS